MNFWNPDTWYTFPIKVIDCEAFNIYYCILIMREPIVFLIKTYTLQIITYICCKFKQQEDASYIIFGERQLKISDAELF